MRATSQRHGRAHDRSRAEISIGWNDTWSHNARLGLIVTAARLLAACGAAGRVIRSNSFPDDAPTYPGMLRANAHAISD